MYVLTRIALAIGLLAGAPAWATSLAPLTVDQMTDASDLIVRGTVETVWTDVDDAGHVYTYATVQVSGSLKGSADAGDIVTVETPGGEYGGVIVEAALAARYSPDEEVVLFLNEKRHGTAYGSVGMYLGKYTVKVNPDDGRDMVVRFTAPWTQPFDARFVPNPPKAERVSLRAFEDGVRARVQTGWDGRPIPGIAGERLGQINRLQPGVR